MLAQSVILSTLALVGPIAFVFAPNEPTFPRFALDPLSFSSLPITVFRSEDYKKAGGLEYVVCISELIDEEHARMLPKCNHGFHVDCIDMWFHSNSTCPLCPSPASLNFSLDSVGSSVEAATTLKEVHSEHGHSPNSCKKPGEGTSNSVGMLMIDIPKQVAHEFSSMNFSLSSNRL